MKIKLTPAQLALLQEKKGGFIDSYKPGLKLKELGLIDVTGTGYFRWTINASGEEALASLTKSSANEAPEIEPAHKTLDSAWPVLKHGKELSCAHCKMPIDGNPAVPKYVSAQGVFCSGECVNAANDPMNKGRNNRTECLTRKD